MTHVMNHVKTVYQEYHYLISNIMYYRRHKYKLESPEIVSTTIFMFFIGLLAHAILHLQ